MPADMAGAGEKSGRKLFLGPCRFVAGSPDLATIPPARLPEIAFVGRSNVGKSSLINALTGRKGLARASVTPGRTQHLNFFELEDRLTLVDLPGYGFAKAPRQMVAAWRQTMREYLCTRPTLARVCLLLDARRGLMETDAPMLELLDEAGVSYLPVLTKADKLSNNALAQVEQAVREELARHAAAYPQLISTSANKGHGLDGLRALLAQSAVDR